MVSQHRRCARARLSLALPRLRLCSGCSVTCPELTIFNHQFANPSPFFANCSVNSTRTPPQGDPFWALPGRRAFFGLPFRNRLSEHTFTRSLQGHVPLLFFDVASVLRPGWWRISSPFVLPSCCLFLFVLLFSSFLL
jgi:hypothetical protein